MVHNAKINLSKINKSNIVDKTYTTNEGNTVTIKELEIELISLKEPKVIYEKDARELVKIGFITEKSTKDTFGNWVNGTTLGDITKWRDKQNSDMPQSQMRTSDGAPLPFPDDTPVEEMPF